MIIICCKKNLLSHYMFKNERYFRRTCKKKGVRLTEQRKVIAQVMASSSDHPDVDELHKRINKIDSKLV